MFTTKGIFTEVHVSYLLVGHTHNDIDASILQMEYGLV